MGCLYTRLRAAVRLRFMHATWSGCFRLLQGCEPQVSLTLLQVALPKFFRVPMLYHLQLDVWHHGVTRTNVTVTTTAMVQ